MWIKIVVGQLFHGTEERQASATKTNHLAPDYEEYGCQSGIERTFC